MRPIFRAKVPRTDLNGLVLCLPMQTDYPSVTVRDIIKSNNGTLSGATWSRLGSGLWTLSFDGSNDYVEGASFFGDISFLAQTFTVKFWVNSGTIDSYDVILGIKPTSSSNFGIQIYFPATGNLNITFIDKEGTVGTRQGKKLNSALSTSTWYHCVITYDGTGSPSTSGVIFYVNGISQTLSGFAGSTGWQTNNNTYRVGILGGDAPLNGKTSLFEVSNLVWAAGRSLTSFNRERGLFGV